MSRTLLLDAGPLGILAHPTTTPRVVACRRWAAQLQVAGWRVILPEVSDYEVRRELLLNGNLSGIAQLDWLVNQLDYLPLTTPVMRRAAEYWAVIRQAGLSTAGPSDIDGDVILAAQAISLGDPNVIVATTNVAHLSRFVTADRWENIVP